MKNCIEIDIATDNEGLLDFEPDWENLGIEPPEGSPGIEDVGFKTVFLDTDKIEYFEGVFELPNCTRLVNLHMVSGRNITAKVNKHLEDYLKRCFDKSGTI